MHKMRIQCAIVVFCQNSPIRRFADSQIFMQNLAELSLGCVYGTHLHFQW